MAIIQQSIAGTIRTAFEESGLSIKKLSEQSGVPYSSTHGLIVDDKDATIRTADRLCAVLGLELRPVSRSKRRKG